MFKEAKSKLEIQTSIQPLNTEVTTLAFEVIYLM